MPSVSSRQVTPTVIRNCVLTVITSRLENFLIHTYIYIENIWRVRSSIPCTQNQVTSCNTEKLHNIDFKIIEISIFHVNDSRKTLLAALRIRTIRTARNQRIFTHISRIAIRLCRETGILTSVNVYSLLRLWRISLFERVLSFYRRVYNLLYVLEINGSDRDRSRNTQKSVSIC
jgi:hypothetical protein